MLKSTYAGGLTVDPTPIVVNELHLLGSRCGRFSDALAFLRTHQPPLENLITAVYPLAHAPRAFEHSARSEAFKVVLDMR